MTEISRASSSKPRMSLDSSVSTANIDRARALLEASSKALEGLSIVKAPDVFDKKMKELSDNEDALGGGLAMRPTPIGIQGEVEAQISFLRKLKFDYTERYAMDKYIKTIVDDEATFVTIDDNEALRKTNEEKKARLKEVKEAYRTRTEAVAALADQYQEKYNALTSVSDEVNTLTSRILDARRALMRLRASHPLSSRLTVSAAQAMLEEQEEQMTMLADAQSTNQRKAAAATQKLSEATRELERLRMERAKKEEEVRQMKVDKEEDEKVVVKLIDWLSASLSVHKSLFMLLSHSSNAENELELTYATPTSPKADSQTFTLTLLFHPNTRVLANASISSDDAVIRGIDLNDLIASRVQANDVPGLVGGVMARVRNVIGS